MEIEEKLQQIREQKCTVRDCDKIQAILQDVGNGMIMPFCMEHFMKLQESKHIWDKSARLVEKDLRNNTGKMVVINNYTEWKKKVKKHFQDITTQGLILTKGKCYYCGKKPIGCKSYFTAVCEEHSKFPLNVLEVAIRNTKTS